MHFVLPSRFTRNSRKGFSNPPSPRGHDLPPRITPHLHPTVPLDTSKQPSPRAAATASAQPGGPSLDAGSSGCPRLWPDGAPRDRLVPEPGGRQDAELCSLSWPHDPEHVGPREEGVPRLHLQPRWPRHDPLLLRQRGHLAERHQPAHQ